MSPRDELTNITIQPMVEYYASRHEQDQKELAVSLSILLIFVLVMASFCRIFYVNARKAERADEELAKEIQRHVGF